MNTAKQLTKGGTCLKNTLPKSTTVDVYLADAENLSPYEDKCLPLLTRSRRSRAERCNDTPSRLRYIADGLLLRRVLGVKADEDLVQNEFGKSALRSFKPHFSLSNAGRYAIIAVSDIPLGADIEQIKEGWPKVLCRYFLPEELKWLEEKPDGERFYTLWTRLESVLKAEGCGFEGWRRRKDLLTGGAWCMESTIYNGHMISCAAKDPISLRLKEISAEALIETDRERRL